MCVRILIMVLTILFLSIYPPNSLAGTSTQANNFQIELSFTDNQKIEIRDDSSGMAVFSGKGLQYLTSSGETSLQVIPGCPEELVLRNILVGAGQNRTYQAATLIEAAGAGTYFINYGNVTFSGGNKIRLNPGFRSAVNSTFKAIIAPCGTF